LCRTCCVVAAPPGRSTCPKCSSDASARTARRRRISRAKSETDRGVSALEIAGDNSFSDGDYRAAMKSYQRAFILATNDVAAHMRLAVKVGRAAVHRGVASGADDWFNIPLPAIPPVSAAADHVARLHTQQIRALWTTSRTADVVVLSERILAVAIASNNAELVLSMQLSLATVLHLLSRYGEAERYLQAIDVRSLPPDHKILCMYYRVCGFIHSTAGNADLAFASLARALHHAEEDEDQYGCVSVLITHAVCAFSLARIDLAAELFLKALAAARDSNQAWNVAYISLEYARVLSYQGDWHMAHAYVNQAAALENPPPVVLEALAEIGIPIAIECDDAHLLRRCANEDALAFAFRSGEPPRLGPVASSFARYFHKVGSSGRAQSVLARALGSVTIADQNYDLPLAVAEFGATRCFARARELLRVRTLLPSADIAIAHLHYFDALVLRRDGNVEGCAQEAALAATCFRKIHWTSHERAAASLCEPATPEAGPKAVDVQTALLPFRLSERQNSVAELVIAGLSNPEVAERLSIATRTVESHMTAILRRAGLRSRYQLLEMFHR
jgi:DNA-binding CsgD family transcriptional regulator/tetratricopeptide (TPR) repeat protein